MNDTATSYRMDNDTTDEISMVNYTTNATPIYSP